MKDKDDCEKETARFARGSLPVADAAPASRTMRVCCQTRSQVDGPELCTVCIEPLPLPGPGADVVLMLHACGHCFHRYCGQ